MAPDSHAPSLFQNAQRFSTHGGQYNAVGHDHIVHNHYYNYSGHTSESTTHENAAHDRPNESVTSPILGFRFPDVSRIFRTRPVDVDVINIIEAECSSLDSDMYIRLMLEYLHGYPLYHPEPRQSLPIEYRKKGIRIGDVGRVTPDGAFDFLFNVDSSQASLVNSSIPRNFETVPPIRVLSRRYFQSGDYLLGGHVHQTQATPPTYKFSAPEGSVLQMPDGATLFEAENTNNLHDLATRHAQSWYEYMATHRSRDIPNGSLYLVTGCIKAADWGIGALYNRPSEHDYLAFISEDDTLPRRYIWRKSGPIATKVGPTSTDVVISARDEPNQCVFIHGYKIALGEKLWKKVKRKAIQASSGRWGTFNNTSSSFAGYGYSSGLGNDSNTLGQSNIPAGPAQGHISHGGTVQDPESYGGVDQDLDDLSISDGSEEESEGITLEPLISAASPTHPSDVIVSVLARLEPEAEVILVHDSEWCSLLPNGFATHPWNLDVKGLLNNIIESCMVVVDRGACTSLVRRTTLASAEDIQHDELGPDHNNDIISPTRPGSTKAIRTASDQYFPDEIIEEILNHLDFQSKMICRAVCSAFRDLIDSSPYFHWQRELALSGMVDGGKYPLATRRQMLEQHQLGWTNFRWTSEQREKHMGGVTVINDNVHAQTDSDQTTIYFNKLASPSRNIEARSWTVDIKETQLDYFTIDPSQDLLVIFEKSFEHQNRHIRRIYLWTLSTGDPYPISSGNHVLTHASTHRQSITHRFYMICGEMLSITFTDFWSLGNEIKVWNWKSGQVVADLVGNHLGGAAFLSERHIIFASKQEPMFIIIDFMAQPQEKQRVSDLTDAYTFGLPPLAETVEVIDVYISSASKHHRNPDFRVPFFMEPHESIYDINLTISDATGNSVEVTILSRGSAFLSLIESAARLNTTHFDWPMWGPDGTRMIVFASADIWHDTYGTKFISTLQPAEQAANYVHIHDFNQMALKWSSSNGDAVLELKEDNDEKGSALEGKMGDPSPYINVTEPTKIAAGGIFQDEVETRLGYRASRWAIPGKPRVRFPEFCGEDGIMFAYGEIVTEEYHFLTL